MAVTILQVQLLCLVALFTSSLGAGCRNGWIQGFNSCYKFVTNQRLLWHQAQDKCEEMGGSLATIESWNELYWLKGYRGSSPILRSRGMWLGGYKGPDNKWYWKGRVADVPMNVSAWVTGQPNNCCGGQGCLAMIGDNPLWYPSMPAHEAFGFDDGSCDRIILKYICERDLNN